MKEKQLKYKILKYITYIAAAIMSIVLIGILFFILVPGIKFILQAIFAPETMAYDVLSGLWPAAVATVYTLAISLAIAVPIGVSTAIYLNEYAAKGKITNTIRFAITNLAGIPSIVYGLFGAAFFVVTCGFGYSVLSGSLTLAIMLLPVIIVSTEEALKTVPQAYREASFGLGASKYQTIFRVVVPSALPGIINAIILGSGKVMGETAALLLTMGTVLQVPGSVMESGRTLSMQIFQLTASDIPVEQMYAEMFVTATVLLVVILIINLISLQIEKRYKI